LYYRSRGAPNPSGSHSHCCFLVLYRCHVKNDIKIIISWYFVVAVSVPWQKWHRDNYYLVICVPVSVPWEKWHRDNNYLILWCFFVIKPLNMLYFCITDREVHLILQGLTVMVTPPVQHSKTSKYQVIIISVSFLFNMWFKNKRSIIKSDEWGFISNFTFILPSREKNQIMIIIILYIHYRSDCDIHYRSDCDLHYRSDCDIHYH
jgi:hypothetical protein